MSNRYHWTGEFDRMLDDGYRAGRIGVRRAIDTITQTTGWPRQACHDRSRKLGLTAIHGTSLRRWTDNETTLLVRSSGRKVLRTIATELGRTPEAVRQKLLKSGYRRELDAFSKETLAVLLHKSSGTIQRWIDDGWIETYKEGGARKVNFPSLGRFVDQHLSAINITRLTSDASSMLLYALYEYRLSED